MTVNDYLVDNVLDKIKWIKSIEKFNDTKILIDTEGKLPDDVTL